MLHQYWEFLFCFELIQSEGPLHCSLAMFLTPEYTIQRQGDVFCYGWLEKKEKRAPKIPFCHKFGCSWWWGAGKELLKWVCFKLEKLCSSGGPIGVERKNCRWAQCGHPCVDNEWETCMVVYVERKTLKTVMKGQMKKESVIIQNNIKDRSRPSCLLGRQVTISLPSNHSRNDGLVGRENRCLRHFWLQCFKLSIILCSLHPDMKPCNDHRELLRARNALHSYFLKSKPERKYQFSGACQTFCIHCTFKRGMPLGWTHAQLKRRSSFYTASEPGEMKVLFWVLWKMFCVRFTISLVEQTLK